MGVAWLYFGEEEFEFRLEVGGEIDAALFKADSPARGIGGKESQQHVAEFLCLFICIVRSRASGKAVEFLIVIVYGRLVDLSGFLAYRVQATAYCVFRCPFPVRS